MWPVAIFLMAVVLFYWLAFCFTIISWLKALGHLLGGNFIRAALYFCIGSGLLLWWFNKDVDFDSWLHGSAVFVSLGALGTFARFYTRQRRAAEVVPPLEPTPVLNININPSTSPHADRRAVHDELAALASALRGAIGPRRIGPTIID